MKNMLPKPTQTNYIKFFIFEIYQRGFRAYRLVNGEFEFITLVFSRCCEAVPDGKRVRLDSNTVLPRRELTEPDLGKTGLLVYCQKRDGNARLLEAENWTFGDCFADAQKRLQKPVIGASSEGSMRVDFKADNRVPIPINGNRHINLDKEINSLPYLPNWARDERRHRTHHN